MKKLISSLLFMLLSFFSFASSNPGPGAPGAGGTNGEPVDLPGGPIDSNVLILLGAAVILIVAFVMYKRINAKRLA
ncbi:hypothetical protein [Ornithobacterium rhinotracheale]|uniref:hypothetical protein n=1 Tax=Ornithobacterium rhinotracheale TaxID=28251 RepID=UPI001FF24D57|nr:hypothetical protein [Ornithobacterium rhinotracheale]MCK0204998.1 hypothetical protein [Ornithobacterium rhinotracheale]